MNKKSRILTAIAVVLYLFSPVDLMPGVPLDDAIVTIIYALTSLKSLAATE